MMPAVVYLDALAALEAVIVAAIPQLEGRVCAGPPPSSEHELIPNLSMEPTRWEYEPEQREKKRSLPGNVVVWNVGRHSCAMVLSIIAGTSYERGLLEAQVRDLWLSAKHPISGMPRPGVLCVPVTACPELGEWVAAFEWESDEWRGDSFDRRFESRCVINALVPALTIQQNVFTVQELRLGLTHDMTTTLTPSTAVPPTVEVVIINEDGTITPAT